MWRLVLNAKKRNQLLLTNVQSFKLPLISHDTYLLHQLRTAILIRVFSRF